MAVKQVIAANIVKCITSSLSLTASSTIVHMIRMSPRGLKSPYSRIIFGLSVGDIIKSCGLFFGVFAVPRGTLDSPMAFGTITTCSYAGFLLVSGSLTTVLYLVFLIYYFWRRVKHRISPQKFAKKEEKYLHVLVWMIASIFPTILVIQKAINPIKYGTGCIISSSPFGCGSGEEELYVECTRGKSAPKLAHAVGAILGLSLLCLLTLLGSITFHVYAIEKSLTSTSSTVAISPSTRNNDNQENSPSNIEEEDSDEEDSNLSLNENTNDANQRKKKSLTRSSLHQSILYIMAFVITFAAPFSFFANSKILDENFEVVMWLASTFVPIFGIFLILIYTRPKVKVLSEMFPESSWLLCFSVVVSSGGEVPPANELNRPAAQNLPPRSESVHSQEQGVSFYSESASTNGVYYEGLRRSMLAVSRGQEWFVEIQDSDI